MSTAKIWVTSDQHFRHANILTFTKKDTAPCWPGCDEACRASHSPLLIRPGFANVDEMDEYMVEQWNKVVKPADHVWHLGDVTMLRGAARREAEPLLDRLNGHMRLILGNHDQNPAEWYSRWFEKIRASNVMGDMLFTHYPVHPSSIGRAKANVHGHIHNNLTYPAPYINVCVEVCDYTPVALEELIARANQF